MEPSDTRTAMVELTLMLMYLSRFSETSSLGEEVQRTWKGYDFDVLKELREEGDIWDGAHPSRTKSVTLSPQGIDKAVHLLEKYKIAEK